MFMGGWSQAMPAEMIGSAKMRALMESWRERFDYLILDPPLILAVTDAVALQVTPIPYSS